MTGVASPTRARSSLVDGEFPLTQEDFDRICKVLLEDSGIHLNSSKATLVYSRLAKRLRGLGLSSFRDYCALLTSGQGAEERRAMLSALTTNLTKFFREPHHFDHLRSLMARELKPRAKSGGRVRLWSAGCSTGEEPYSIAMTVLEVMPDAASYDVRILATDIDPKVIETALTGRYSADAVNQSPPNVRKYFNAGRDGALVGQDARDLIAFRELNLMADWPMRGKFDVIFCRNVAIYFEEDTQVRLWSRFADKLCDGGVFYAGHSERVMEPRLISDGMTTYVLKGRGR